MSFVQGADDRETLVGLVRSAVDKAVGEVPTLTPQMATVTTYAEDPAQGMPTATVVIDGDLASNQIQVPNGTGQWLDAGDRVVIVFIPPHGALVWGRVGLIPPTPAARIEWIDGGVAPMVGNVRSTFPFSSTVFAVSAVTANLGADAYLRCGRSGLWSATGSGGITISGGGGGEIPRIELSVYDSDGQHLRVVSVDEPGSKYGAPSAVFGWSEGEQLRLTGRIEGVPVGTASLTSDVTAGFEQSSTHLAVCWCGPGQRSQPDGGGNGDN